MLKESFLVPPNFWATRQPTTPNAITPNASRLVSKRDTVALGMAPSGGAVMVPGGSVSMTRMVVAGDTRTVGGGLRNPTEQFQKVALQSGQLANVISPSLFWKCLCRNLIIYVVYVINISCIYITHTHGVFLYQMRTV